MLRTILAETPLVRNLENPTYIKILLQGKASLEEVFAQVVASDGAQRRTTCRLQP